MKTFYFLLLFYTSTSLCLWAQPSLEAYLQTHAQDVSLDLEEELSIPALDTSLSSYHFFISGEFHGVSSNHKIKFKLLKYFHQYANVRYLVIESGHTTAFLLKKFLTDGDTTHLYGYYLAEKAYWQELRAFNQKRSEKEQVQVIGIDFERDEAFLKAMPFLLPEGQPPKAIEQGILALRKILSHSITGKERVKITKSIQKNLRDKPDVYQAFFKENFPVFQKVINNPVSITPGTKRDKFAYKNMLEEYQANEGGNYYAQYGISHVNLTYGNIAGLLNTKKSSPFKREVLALMPHYVNCKARHKNEVWNADGYGLLMQAGIKDVENMEGLFENDITFIDLRHLQDYPKLKNSAHFLMWIKNQPPL